jgi:uncharacterized protein (TIGR00255 family)
VLEIRSLNNRYLKPTFKLPEHCQSYEGELDKLVRKRVERGSVTYTLRIRNTGADAAYKINRAALDSYLRQLDGAAATLPVTVDLAAVLGLPGVCQAPEETDAEREREWAIIRKLTAEALDKLIEMRMIEGKALRDDLHAQCGYLRERAEAIRTLSPQVVGEYHKRLRTRVDNLLGEAKLELAESDVLKEVALFADRCDISEELARLASHMDQFLAVCDQDERAGRRLEFLAQEMLREANTIGSKSNNAEIAQHVVEIKGVIERLKEQVQNVE